MSAEIISLEAQREAIISDRWDVYVAAVKRAQQTYSIEDGIAVGTAYRAFLDLFLSPHQRDSIAKADVVMMGRRG
ncbi:MAG: hypothetical protein ABII76_23175 [Pseudomonadota bacterium]